MTPEQEADEFRSFAFARSWRHFRDADKIALWPSGATVRIIADPANRVYPVKRIGGGILR